MQSEKEEGLPERRRFLVGVAGAVAAFAMAPRLVMAEKAPGSAKTGAAEALPRPSEDNFEDLIGSLSGFSATLIREHLSLLKRYRYDLATVNGRARAIDLATADSLNSAWRTEVLGWLELHNAVRLHELYFDTLTPRDMRPSARCSGLLDREFGSYDQWWGRFRATALAVRGWAVMGWDRETGKLLTFGLDTVSQWPVGVEPLLAVDMAEHAYVLDYYGRPLAYVEAWSKRIDWAKLDKRLDRLGVS